MNNIEIAKLDTGLLKKEDLLTLKEILPEIRYDFEVKAVFRTEVEARASVLNELHFPTPFAKYWQSIREQQVHFDQLVGLSFDYRRKKVELKQLQDGIKKAKGYKKELIEIDIEQKQYELICCEKVGADRIREIKQWSKIKKELIVSDPDLVTSNPDGLPQLKSYTEQFIWEMYNSGNNISPADAQNIIGKALTAKKECIRLNVWDEVKDKLLKRGLSHQQLRQIGA